MTNSFFFLFESDFPQTHTQKTFFALFIKKKSNLE
jgi:hypothetical protein